jgi:GNAT superfamily N-acetyltransferase
MTTARGLLDAQAARFAGLDPLLPPAAPNPVGEVLTAALTDGRRVAGVLTRTVHRLGAPNSLWSARDTWEMFPLVGDSVGPGLDALLRAWRQLMDRVGAPGTDSSVVVTWPSRDAEASQVLLAHGFQPLSVQAVRRPGRVRPPEPGPPPRGLTIRRATRQDLDVAVQLALAELAYSAMVGGAIVRREAADIKRTTLRFRISQGDPVWLAERDGVAIGLAECWVTEANPEERRAFPVPAGRWGYINALSVLPGARGGGIGQALMARAHRDLHSAGVNGTYLYYNPPNPLSSVFWPRQGYRPMWTIWETRPAGALR